MRSLILFVVAAALALAVIVRFGGRTSFGALEIRPSLENVLATGEPYTPSTQSILRGTHWLEGLVLAQLELNGVDELRIEFEHKDGEDDFTVVGLPGGQLVPRLHYLPADPPDAFDAYNLLLAEFSRNSLSVPIGKRGDRMAHFETTLEEGYPWGLSGDYDFVPNERFRPVRFSVINNCLRAGLWELSATDRSGEIYHGWIEVPEASYVELVARTNGLTPDFVREALAWRTVEVPLELGRLRNAVADLGVTAARLAADSESGYSSQDSRRKLSKGYAKVERDGEQVIPTRLSDLTTGPVYLSEFEEPGRYSSEKRREFDLGFLREVRGARVRRTSATTDYAWRSRSSRRATLELEIDLGPWCLMLGNLPTELLVPQEDFALYGFGVGILSSGGFAERRAFLLERGPAPSFAYLCRQTENGLVAVNSHDYGLEQIFIRTHQRPEGDIWEVTVTSYERIVDIVKYEVVIPAALHVELREAALNYQAPLYRTYRDDNLR